MQTSPQINIELAMITDNAYCPYTAIALTSLRLVKSNNIKYNIHICTSNVSADNLRRLSLLQHDSFNIHFYQLSELDYLFDQCRNAKISATPTSLYKFYLANILDLDKVIYVDGDVLFYKDLENIWHSDILNQGYYAAVTPEDIGTEQKIPPQCNRIGCKNKVYFNSGLMLLNLKQMRNDNIPEKLLDYKLNGINFLMDQDAFNAIIGHKVYILPPYTFPPYYDIEAKRLPEKYQCKSKKEIFNKLTVLHLCSRRKPWVIKLPYITHKYMTIKKLHHMQIMK